MTEQKSSNEIEFKQIRPLLEEVSSLIISYIAGDKFKELQARHAGLPSMIKLTLKVSHVTWQSIEYLCRSLPPDESRKEEIAITVSPITRTILDSLFSVIFVFDKPKTRSREFISSGWRDAKEYHELLFAKYGSDPKWKDWFESNHKWIDSWEGDITPEEKKDPKQIKWWPNPGKIVSRYEKEFVDHARWEFLDFCNDWYYSHMSGDSHLSMMGLARRGGQLVELGDPEQRKIIFTKYRSNTLLNALIIYVCLLSEVAGELKVEAVSSRLLQIWATLNKAMTAEEIFKKRYQEWLKVPG